MNPRHDLLDLGAACIDYHTNRSGRTSKEADKPSLFSLSAEIDVRIKHRASTRFVYVIQSWRSLPSIFVFGTIENTLSIIRTNCNYFCRIANENLVHVYVEKAMSVCQVFCVNNLVEQLR